MSFQEAINGPLGVGLALALGQAVPPSLGYPLARRIADRISSRKQLAIVKTVRANQWVVSRGRLHGGQLDDAVRDTFRNTARSLYDLYHHVRKPSAMQQLIEFNRQAEQMIDRTQLAAGSHQGRTGMILVGVHLSNFDLVLQAAGQRGVNVQVLSAAQPGGGYRWQNDLRRQQGLYITPASTAALRQAAQRLQTGGSVLTGIDRPVWGSKYQPRFFGRPASLPVHHIYLALKTGAPIYIFAAILGPDGIYRIRASDPIYLRSYEDHTTEMVCNAEAVLAVAESFICQAPQQWSMFYPVWPDALKELE